MGIVYRKISCAITNDGLPAKQGRHPQEKDLGIVSNAAIVHDSRMGILWVGKDGSLPKEFKSKKFKHISCKGLTAYPGLVDPHTHLVFDGDRSLEFSLRMRGASYQEIATAGGGIITSMKATRGSTKARLSELVQQRLKIAHQFGVRLIEAKSGYGLTARSEINCLEAIRDGAAAFKKIAVQATCLSAHAVPPEFRERSDEYIELILKDILPIVKKRGLARFVDAFCDPGFFTIDQSRRLLSAAKNMGFDLRLHGEELANTGAAELASELAAYSVDHLLKISEKGIKRLAASSTVGILLPGTSFYLREPPAPARKLIDAGVCVALATDFNPGTCPTQNLPFIGTLAAVQLGMTTPEIIAAITWNGAKSLGEEAHFGAIIPGFIGEPVFTEGDHPSALFYKMAGAGLVFPKSLA